MPTLRAPRGARRRLAALMLLVAGLVGLVGLAGLAACSKPAPPMPERPPTPVTVAVAEARDVPVYLDEIGRIVAREVVSIQPQVSGRITAIHFVDGADVKVGEPLFTIDPRPYQARLDAAQASLAERQATLAWTQLEFERVKSLVDTKAISQSDFDLRKNGMDVAQANLAQGQAAVDTAKLDLEYCHIVSPIEGRAGQRLVDLGNVVTANEGSLVVIQRLDPIYADFTVTENDLTAVQSHMAKGTLQVEVRLPDEPDAPRRGTLTFVDNSVADASGTVKLRATLDNRDRRFWPGRFVKVRLVLETLPGAVVVPTAAPQLSAQGHFIYVATDAGTAELRTVTLGQQLDDGIVVMQGVAPGERVVVVGQVGVTPGGKIAVRDPVATP